MLIVRSPLRISLAGGGTDLPSYYNKYGGAVINTAIDRYFYVFLSTEDNDSLEISSADFKSFFRHNGDAPMSWEGELELPRAILHHFGVNKGLRVFIASEIPPGTGLGSSSSFTVASVLDEFYGPEVGVPAYILASLVGYRMTVEGDHWASDVVFGATLGWVVGHTVAGKHKEIEVAGFKVLPYTMDSSGHPVVGINLLKRF